MKAILYFLFFFVFTFSIHAQQYDAIQTSTTKTNQSESKSPLIITKIALGETLHFSDQSIKFIKVIEDSRCPKYTNCIWEGQAKAVLSIYKGKKVSKEITVNFGSKDVHPENKKELFKADDNTILAYNLTPYPVSGKKINSKKYVLELIVK